MQDFYCKDADEIHSSVSAKQVHEPVEKIDFRQMVGVSADSRVTLCAKGKTAKTPLTSLLCFGIISKLLRKGRQESTEQHLQ